MRCAMDLMTLVPGIVGAFVGVIGWLGVGMLIQRRQFVRMARNAARAVYFELDVNRSSVEVACELGSFAPLDRSSFERLLPELATLFPASELRTIVAAYMSHAGYQQASADAELPATVRAQLLEAVRAAHDEARGAIKRRAFSERELRALAAAEHSTAPDAGRRSVRHRTVS
jgi:hypothetical protein